MHNPDFMSKFFLLCSLLLLSWNGKAQSVNTFKSEKIFLEPNETSKNCYTVFYPNQLPIKAYLFLIPGFGETAEDVLIQTDLPIKLAQKGILTVIPTLQDGVFSFGVDDLSQQTLQTIIQQVKQKNQLDNLPFFIGGFSIGGSCAIKYAEEATTKPRAVFAIDPPLDFERFYNSSKRTIRLAVDTEPNQESVYMINRIEKEMNGTPKTALANFYRISPYSFSDVNQTAVKKLLQIPIRIYAEADINWSLTERNADFTSINVTECSAMINELNQLGSHTANLILTQNKGFRKPDNRRHPHSWSIVDNDELIAWLLMQ